jgi:hypothetical protein
MIDVKPDGGIEALYTHESSHDTFDASKHVNWLLNGAGIGCYAHGRVHQQYGHTIYVGDLVHKRGHLMTDDLLLMEEQALFSMGDPLTAPSRLGDLMAMAMLPTMSTANGEGSLIAYYRHGVVAFDTFEAPRETRVDGDGQVIQQGWSTKKLVNHLLNTVSAVGRYAVATLTRDHLFRSVRGLHFLKTVLGEGTFNSENINRISIDVDPILEQDVDLDGASVGFWLYGDRMFATTGMVYESSFSTTSFGRGFVSWNQASTFTEDRTPIPLWEGLWVVDYGIVGIHRFVSFGDRDFGFICSDRDGSILEARIDKDLDHDVRDGADVCIEWSFETGRFTGGLGSDMAVSDCVIELLANNRCQCVRVYARTDRSGSWSLWKEFSPADKLTGDNERILLTESLSKPPASCRESTWIQLRVEGVGPVEVRLIDLDFSPTTVKAGRQKSYVTSFSEKDFFEINNAPAETRWP